MKRIWVIIIAFSLFWSSSNGHPYGLGHETAIAESSVYGPNEFVKKVGIPYDPAVVIPEQQSPVNGTDPTKPDEKGKGTLTTGFHQFLGESHISILQGNGKGKLGNYSLRFILFRNLRL
jgi:hypothetical protein